RPPTSQRLGCCLSIDLCSGTWIVIRMMFLLSKFTGDAVEDATKSHICNRQWQEMDVDKRIKAAHRKNNKRYPADEDEQKDAGVVLHRHTTFRRNTNLIVWTMINTAAKQAKNSGPLVLLVKGSGSPGISGP